MARIRTVKPEFWKNEDLSELPEATHLLAAGLLNYADDEGYLNANPRLIQAECSPLREPSVSIQDSLIQLQGIGFLELGRTADGKSYGHIVKFLQHQRINRPTPSKIKDLQISWEGSVSPHIQLREASPLEGKGREQGKEQGKEQGGGARARDPSPMPETPKSPAKGSRLPDNWWPSEDLSNWAKSKRPDLNLQATTECFVDYWRAAAGQKGLKRNWDAAYRYWIRKEDHNAKAGQANRRNSPSKTDRVRAVVEAARAVGGSEGADGDHGDVGGLLPGS